MLPAQESFGCKVDVIVALAASTMGHKSKDYPFSIQSLEGTPGFAGLIGFDAKVGINGIVYHCNLVQKLVSHKMLMEVFYCVSQA